MVSVGLRMKKNALRDLKLRMDIIYMVNINLFSFKKPHTYFFNIIVRYQGNM